jgi:hypothetical protein
MRKKLDLWADYFWAVVGVTMVIAALLGVLLFIGRGAS